MKIPSKNIFGLSVYILTFIVVFIVLICLLAVTRFDLYGIDKKSVKMNQTQHWESGDAIDFDKGLLYRGYNSSGDIWLEGPGKGGDVRIPEYFYKIHKLDAIGIVFVGKENVDCQYIDYRNETNAISLQLETLVDENAICIKTRDKNYVKIYFPLIVTEFKWSMIKNKNPSGNIIALGYGISDRENFIDPTIISVLKIVRPILLLGQRNLPCFSLSTITHKGMFTL